MERLKRFAPPGMGISGFLAWTVGSIAVSTLFSMGFLMDYVRELNNLMRHMSNPVFSGLTMTPFGDLIVFPMVLFRLSPVIPLLYTVQHYNYYYQETKSIYIMKRLGNPWEIHIRSLVLPILGSVLVIAAGCVVYLFYYLIYIFCTPEILLPANL